MISCCGLHFEKLLQDVANVERAEIAAHGDDLTSRHQHERAPALAAPGGERLHIKKAAAAANGTALRKPRRELLDVRGFQAHVGEVEVGGGLGGLRGPEGGNLRTKRLSLIGL